MRKHYLILFSFVILVSLPSCTWYDAKSYYNDGRAYYENGEITQAVSCYIKCVYYGHESDSRIVANSYCDLAAICHQAGNHKMAYELSEKGADYFRMAGLENEQYTICCLSAIYNAYMGNADEALIQLRHLYSITQDSVLSNLARSYTEELQLHQLPEVPKPNIQVSASELYYAEHSIKYYLYKRPYSIKLLLSTLLFFFAAFGVYLTHGRLLQHIRVLRLEKESTSQLQLDLKRSREEYNEKCNSDIERLCVYLRTHTEDLKKELEWGNYSKMCSLANLRFGNIVDKIDKIAMLNETEKRLCVLVLINLPRNKIAEILPYAPNSVGKLKNIVSKKIGTDGKNMHKTLYKMAMDIE